MGGYNHALVTLLFVTAIPVAVGGGSQGREELLCTVPIEDLIHRKQVVNTYSTVLSNIDTLLHVFSKIE